MTSREAAICRKAGRELASRIAEAGDSLRAAAPLVGCSYSHLSLLVRGLRRPGLALAYKIENYWSVPVDAWGLRRVD